MPRRKRDYVMRYSDLDLAREQHAALQRLIDEHAAGGGTDARRLRGALALCRVLAQAVHDDYCRRKVLLVEECAAELFCSAEPRADFLKSRIREALELLLSRLYSLERTRRYGQPLAARGLTPRFAG